MKTLLVAEIAEDNSQKGLSRKMNVTKIEKNKRPLLDNLEWKNQRNDALELVNNSDNLLTKQFEKLLKNKNARLPLNSQNSQQINLSNKAMNNLNQGISPDTYTMGPMMLQKSSSNQNPSDIKIY